MLDKKNKFNLDSKDNNSQKINSPIEILNPNKVNVNNLENLDKTNNISDKSLDFNPKNFFEYLGQDKLKKKLELYTNAANLRNEPLDHMLISGPPGLGKTTISKIMAQMLGVNIKTCSGPSLERTGDLVAILSNLSSKDILFIDEIHRLNINIEEILYSAMEKFQVNIIIGQGTGADTINLPISTFTLIGATTKAGSLSAPLRSRFGISERIDFYNIEDLTKIILQSAKFLNIKLNTNSAKSIAKASRGTPRIAKKILRRVRDFAQINFKNKVLDEKIIINALEFIGIDQSGLSHADNLLLKKILIEFNGGPVGLETLASLIGEDKETIEFVYEPYLLREGYLEKTTRGRCIPANAQAKLKQKYLGQKIIF